MEWIRGLPSGFSLQYGFARAPGLSGAPVTDYICIRKNFNDLRADIFLEKSDDRFYTQLRVYKENKKAKNVRIALTRDEGSSVSRLADEGYKLFEDLPFGSYQLMLTQNLLEKGNYFFANR